MKLQSNNATIIANEKMNLALIQLNGNDIFMKHDELLRLGEILNEYDYRDEIRDLINDYVTQITNPISC